MHLRGTGEANALIEFSLDEPRTLNNALNEVCNCLDIREFATRMGVERDDARWLLREVGDAIRAVEERPTEAGREIDD